MGPGRIRFHSAHAQQPIRANGAIVAHSAQAGVEMQARNVAGNIYVRNVVAIPCRRPLAGPEVRNVPKTDRGNGVVLHHMDGFADEAARP